MPAQQLACDYSFHRPLPVDIARAGYKNVLRYVSPDQAKNATATEIAGLHSVGLGVGFIWESTAMRAVYGSSAGLADGTEALRQLRDLSVSPGTVIFANIGDWHTTQNQLGGIFAYYSAFRSALKEFSAGCGGYGNRYIIERLHNTGNKGIWFQNAMSVMGLSGDVVSPAASMYQRVSPTLSIPGTASGDWDEDVYGFGPVPEIPWYGPEVTLSPSVPLPAKHVTGIEVTLTYADGTTESVRIK